MNILAIDPGTTQTAFLFWNSDVEKIEALGKIPSESIIPLLQTTTADIVSIELLACYGLPVGKEIFETAYWIGEFRRVCKDKQLVQHPVYRQQVKLHHCQSNRANDATIRQALIDRFGAVGTKKLPGRLYGVKADIWSALAIAVFEADRSRIPTIE